ncbi:YbgC/FadM family acyl-CoA thioesterase [Alteraurantiacibacter aquimixticola]|uniref:YbgC/FadM family acyl-CoA thioesterase n=1 Tax=Alteraurantiacibacter aquimixticola TaxID=2489173 RepID=A0A4T3EYZ1_9SPHN|nr:YbgC/FadM family acyl-CoA thioesterase [Alteraurantiacibacter aquimixticola]TIX49876.1 YbgC/FadM family acyl-CoA thioesterase [Alteraurantiacibacter aquimixticola]
MVMGDMPQPPTGIFEGQSHLFPLRIYYEDTDLSGLVYHANYLKYAERARSDLLRLLNIDQRAAHEAGEGNYAVAEANIRFFAPARLDDSLTVQTRCVELKAASVRLAQVIMRGDDKLVEIAVRVGFIAPNGRPRRQPDEWRKAFDNFFAKETE